MPDRTAPTSTSDDKTTTAVDITGITSVAQSFEHPAPFVLPTAIDSFGAFIPGDTAAINTTGTSIIEDVTIHEHPPSSVPTSIAKMSPDSVVAIVPTIPVDQILTRPIDDDATSLPTHVCLLQMSWI
jgi:hypothetical protein